MSELNVITACFPCGEKSAVTEKRWQWSYGQILKFQGIPDLPDVFNVHFSGQPSAGTAKSWPAQNAQVEIPNEYLETGGPVYAWIFLHEGEEDGETVYDITIPVKRRPQPTDEPITPTQQSAIDTAIAILQSSAATASEQATIATEAAETATGAVDAVTEAARDAAQSALSASNAATIAQTAQRAAEQSATDADMWAREAALAKTDAQTAAQNANLSSSEAFHYAGLAEEAKEDAQAAKTAAEASASAAATSATQASESASTASQKASEASASATAAQTSATNAEAAKTGAEAAQAAAETAQCKAEQAQANAEEAEATAEWYAERVERFLPTDTASGEIASFPDGADGVPMQSVVVTMTPQQDLHGQDAPYPAGGGKNKFHFSAGRDGYTWSDGFGFSIISANDDGVTFNGTATSAHTFSVTGAEITLTAGTYRLSTESGNVGVTLLENGSAVTTNYGTTGNSFTLDHTATLTISVTIVNEASFNNKFIGFQIESGTTPTAWSPYSNECPISGWDEGTVWGTGGNVWNEEWTAGTINANNGRNYDVSPTTIRSVSFCPCKGGATYYSTMRGTASIYVRLYWYAEDGTYIDYSNLSAGAQYSATAPDNATQFKVSITGTYGTTYLHDFAITANPTQTGYQPYTGASYHSDFPSTVYGGEWAVTEGEIAPDTITVVINSVFDIATTSYIKSDATDGYQKFDAIFPRVPQNQQRTQYSDQLEFVADSIWSKVGCPNCFCINLNQVHVNISNDLLGITDYTQETVSTAKAKLNAYLAEHPVTVTIPIAPTAIEVDPHTIPSRLGDNNVWSDAGDISVVYRADVGLYIDKRINEAVSALS